MFFGGLGRRRAAVHGPARCRAWAQRATAIRWNVRRAARGLPLLPVPEVPPVMTPRAVAMRRRREIAHRLADYRGVPYDDRMASSAEVRRAYLELYGPDA